MSLNKTNIEWALNPDGTKGYTWNPITGCLNGCEYCYARKLANGRLKKRYLANLNLPSDTHITSDEEDMENIYKDPFYPRFWPEKLNFEGVRRPHTTGYGDKEHRPKGIFVCSMSDLFGIGVSEDWTNKVLQVIRDKPRHRFYLLTKQPQNLIKFSPFPDNAWVGVSVTDPTLFIDACWELAKIDAKVKYLSFEPLLEAINGGECEGKRLDGLALVDWVIIGAQTNPTVMPKIEWVREIVQAADKAGIPVFLKDSLSDIVPPNGDREPWLRSGPAGFLRLRQEMPK